MASGWRVEIYGFAAESTSVPVVFGGGGGGKVWLWGRAGHEPPLHHAALEAEGSSDH